MIRQKSPKLLNRDGELYVLARSAGRQDKERAMRRRRLERLWKRLHELQRQTLSRDELLLKLGAAKKAAGRAYGLVRIQVPATDQPVTADTFAFALNRKKLRQVRRRAGRYLLRSNLTSDDPVQLWTWYIQLTEVEQAFKELKGDLSIRPIYHQLIPESRRISSSPFWPIAFRPPSRPACAPWPRGLHPGPPWKNSPPSKWSMCICPPPMGAP
jgi:hypothetical protein